MGGETILQLQVINWARQQAINGNYPDLAMLYHIPNGLTHGSMIARHPDIGIIAGMPDLHLPISRSGYLSLYIEIKTPSGRLTANQMYVHMQLLRHGNLVLVLTSLQSIQSVLMDYLDGRL